MKDLTTIEGRKAAVAEIEESLINNLRSCRLKMAKNAVCRIGDYNAEISIEASEERKIKGYKTEFASGVDFYIKDKDGRRKANEINFGSSDWFSPKDKAEYWRTIHAASILENWAISCSIIEKHCKMYRDLIEEIHIINKK